MFCLFFFFVFLFFLNVVFRPRNPDYQKHCLSNSIILFCFVLFLFFVCLFLFVCFFVCFFFVCFLFFLLLLLFNFCFCGVLFVVLFCFVFVLLLLLLVFFLFVCLFVCFNSKKLLYVKCTVWYGIKCTCSLPRNPTEYDISWLLCANLRIHTSSIYIYHFLFVQRNAVC